MFNMLPSPALLAQLEQDERDREQRRLEAELERVRCEMSMRAETV